MDDATNATRVRPRLRVGLSGANRELMRASGDRPVPVNRRPRLHRAAALPADQALPPALPYPEGWFCVGLSREWPPGQVRTRPLMDREVVLYRTRRGILKAIGPYCPHLGAHLGVGAEVDGEHLVCPYHKYAYNTDGVCVSTPNAPPPKATLQQQAVWESNGIVYLWYSPDDSPPAWKIPEEPLDGFYRPVYRTYELASHPQEVLENLVDYDHSMTLHGLAIRQTKPPTTNGPHFRVDLRVGRRASLLGELVVDHPVDLYGLGYLQLRFELPQYGLAVRNWFLPTPIAPWRIHLRIIGSCKVTPTAAVPSFLRNRSATQLSHLASYLVMQELVKITHADRPIWQHKRYQPHPRLSKADGPIGLYRHWASQFYPETGPELAPGAHDESGASSDTVPRAPARLR